MEAEEEAADAISATELPFTQNKHPKSVKNSEFRP